MHKNNVVVLIWICFLGVASAQPKGFKLVTDETTFKIKFAEAANTTQTIKSDFIQEKNLTVLSEKITSKGVFLFKKQNRVKMEYTSPFKYLLVINKDKVMIKDGQKTTVLSSKSNKLFEHVNKIIVDCVQGTAMENKDFTHTLYDNNDHYILVLTPSGKELKEFFSTISIYIEKKDHSVQKMDMAEASGDNTLITFTNKQFNTPIPDEVFGIK